MAKLIAFLALVLFLLGATFLFGNWLPDLATLSDNHRALAGWCREHMLASLVLFFFAYFLVAAFSVPVSTLMTVAAGALFGFAAGLALVSFASSLGALAAFLASRYFLRDAVTAKFGRLLGGVNKRLERDGAQYLFGLRLVPAFPFFAVNVIMALTPIPAWTFYWVSQIGMLAGTAIYVNAGTQLSRLESLSGILSPSVTLSLVLLGLFPFIAKAIFTRMKPDNLRNLQ